MAETPVEKFVRLSVFIKKERKALADKNVALKDGSFPIRNVKDLKNAISAFGRADDAKKPMVKAHIKKRAAALNAGFLIPKGW